MASSSVQTMTWTNQHDASDVKSLCLASRVLNTISSSAAHLLGQDRIMPSLGAATALRVNHLEHLSSDSVGCDFSHVTRYPLKVSGW